MMLGSSPVRTAWLRRFSCIRHSRCGLVLMTIHGSVDVPHLSMIDVPHLHFRWRKCCIVGGVGSFKPGRPDARPGAGDLCRSCWWDRATMDPSRADGSMALSAKTALITGITGQDGAHLARLLLEKGYT